jgi:branched-chain amino acid transport system permease protein
VTSLIQHVVDALSVGSTYALLALGLTLVYSIMNLINFAYGMLLVWAAYFSLALTNAGLPFAPAAILTVLAVTLLTMALGRIAFRPFLNAPPITLLITSFGVLLILQYIAIVIWSEQPRILKFPSFFQNVLTVGSVRVPVLELITIGTSIVVVGVYFALLQRTSLGAQVRAAAEMPDTTRLVGVKPDRVLMTVFAISGAIAGVVGLLWFAKSGAVDPHSELDPTLKAFIAIVLGGLGSTRGAIFGGLALGAIEVIMSVALPEGALGYQPAIVFAIVIGILIFRPGGIANTTPDLAR